MRVSVDIGFGFVKGLSETGVKACFPSVLMRRNDSGLKNIIGGALNNYSVQYWEENSSGRINEKRMYVGEAAMTNGASRKWEDKSAHFNVDDLKIFISTAIGLVNPLNTEVDLCVGLPMSYYSEKKDELREALQGLNGRISIGTAKEPLIPVREIKVKSVFIFPQGAGAYYAAVYNTDGNIKNYEMANSSVGVVDIGYRTVDFIVMVKSRNGITMRDDLSGSLEDDGMNLSYQYVQKAVSSQVGRALDLIDIEKALFWFDGVLEFRSQKLNLVPFEGQAYKERAETIASKLKLKWGSESDLLSTILITGGGGEILFPIMKGKFEQAKLQDNAIYANCEGYLGAQARKMARANNQ